MSTSDHLRFRISRSRQPVNSRSRTAAVGRQDGQPPLLRNMLRVRAGLVDLPRYADGLGLAQRNAELFQFVAAQKSFARRLSKLFNVFRRILHVGREQGAGEAEGEHAGDRLLDAIRRDRARLADLDVQLGDGRARYFLRLHVPDLGQHMLANVEAIEAGRSGLALGRDFIGEISLGELGDRNRAAHFVALGRRVGAAGDSPKQLAGLVARLRRSQ
jgi:hypothetical protein